MTVRLTIRTASWRAHIAQIASTVNGLVPVIKGNGYGFGRNRLAETAAEFCDTVAVGTVHELAGLPDELRTVVLTPTLVAPESTSPILTVGNDSHIAALGSWKGCVIVKLATSMQRYGGDVSLIERATGAGLDVIGVSMHPALARSNDVHRQEIEAALSTIDPSLPVWVSHLDPAQYAALPDSHSYRLRLGTMLWHGNKSALQLGADVLDIRRVSNGDAAGYQLGLVPGAGHLVMIGAGTAHGVTALADGRSPFHFDRQRLALHELPHMHTSMTFVPDGGSLPTVGDWVDLQRPMHMTAVDRYEWL